MYFVFDSNSSDKKMGILLVKSGDCYKVCGPSVHEILIGFKGIFQYRRRMDGPESIVFTRNRSNDLHAPWRARISKGLGIKPPGDLCHASKARRDEQE